MMYEIIKETNTVKFSTYDMQKSEWIDYEFPISSISKFEIYNKPIYRRAGGLKSFYKEGMLSINNKSYTVDVDLIKELKQYLKGKVKAEKYEKYESKRTRYGMESRRAIDWTYTVTV